MPLTIDSTNSLNYHAESFVDSMEAYAHKSAAADEVNEVAIRELRELAVYLANLGSKSESKELLADTRALSHVEKLPLIPNLTLSHQQRVPCIKGKQISFEKGLLFPFKIGGTERRKKFTLVGSLLNKNGVFSPIGEATDVAVDKVKEAAHKVEKFVRHHKVEVAVGLGIIAAVITVIVVSGGSATPTAGAGGAAALGAAFSDGEKPKSGLPKHKNNDKAELSAVASSSDPTLDKKEEVPLKDITEREFSVIKDYNENKSQPLTSDIGNGLAINQPVCTPQEVVGQSTAEVFVENALKIQRETNAFAAHTIWDTASRPLSLTSAVNEASKGVFDHLSPLGGMATALPEMLGMPWNEIIAKGHEAIDSLFVTNQAAQYHDESLREKLFRTGLDVATLTPGLLAKMAQGAARVVEALNIGEKLAYVSEELGLSRAVEFLKPAAAVEELEAKALKNVVADEIRILKNIETTEAGVVSVSEHGIAKETEIVLLEKNELLEKVSSCGGRELLEGTMLESFERFKNAENLLQSYAGKYLTEIQIREIIQKAGIKTFPRPHGVPENFRVRLSGKGAGMEYVHPTNPHIRVRIMPGKPHSPFPHQQKPYIIQKIDGKALDKFGNRVPPHTSEAHIPIDEFTYRSS